MNIAIVVAAGAGRRFCGNGDKIYLDLLGKPLLVYSLVAMEAASYVDGVVLVVAAGQIDFCRTQIVGRFGCKKVMSIISGGEYRQGSVY